MPITVATAALRSALNATAAAATGRMLEQRLAHLTARAGTLTVHAGDALASSVTATFPADTPDDTPRATAYAPHRFLHEIAEHLTRIAPTATLDLADENGITLTAQHPNSAHAFTATIKRELPPTTPDTPADTPPAFTLDTTREALAALLEPQYAVSRQAWDTTLGGMYLDGQANAITLVGTDGNRLALATTDLPDQDASGITGRALAREHARAIRHALEHAGGDRVRVSVNATLSHLTAATAGDTPLVSVTVPLREAAAFPKYQRILPPPDERTTIRVNREALLAAVKRLKPLSLAGANAITITAPENEPELRLEVTSANGEPATEVLPLDMGLSEEARVRVNAAYLADALEHYRGEHVAWQLGPVTSVRPTDASADAGRLDVIAQLRQP